MLGNYHSLSLYGKTALVTGGSGGIGAETAFVLGSRGANVVVHYYKNKEKALATLERILSAGGKGMVIGGDLKDSDAVNEIINQVLNEFGPIDVLINNAGGNVDRRPFLDCSEKLWNEVVDLNLFSTVTCAKAVLPQMIEKHWGRIINVSSTAARIGGADGGNIPYAAMKGAIETLTRGLANEVVKNGITVNAVAPGPVNTSLFDKFPERRNELIRKSPMGRIGQPNEIGELIAFLSSEVAGYITGTVVTISGGR